MPDTPDITAYRAFLTRIAQDVCEETVAHAGQHGASVAGGLSRFARLFLGMDDGTTSPVSDRFEREAIRHALVESVRQLEQPDRALLWMRWHEGLSTPAIAERMSIEHDVAARRETQAVARLREVLEGTLGSQWRASCERLLEESSG